MAKKQMKWQCNENGRPLTVYLFPWWPVQALLQTNRIIFSGAGVLFGDAVTGVIAPCMKDGVLLISFPYFKLL